ncbi:MAG: hypothetical protein JXA77_08620 [Bacteroidales bacterium]|nr:hypothetical protein [Bacteroidales bacterium]MBN2820994.1 hypothetical protein [Bacteroidales bacterium]
MNSTNGFHEVFRVFQDKESFFEGLTNKDSNRIITKQILTICLFGLLYGLIMGGYHSFLQAFVAGLKMMFLFITSLLICFPSFYIIQQVLGSQMTFRQMVLIILSGFLLSATITLSFAPIVMFFLVTGNNYHFLQLLHVGVFLFAGIFGMKLMLDALKYACEKKSIYPQTGVVVFRVWVVILAFVGIQLAWNLRPFMSDKGEEFKLFRKYEGNFYTAIVYSIEQLGDKDKKANVKSRYKTNLYQPEVASDSLPSLLKENK